ncbi:MAG: DUF1614 domain-containing protein [Chloroflexota bacterium]
MLILGILILGFLYPLILLDVASFSFGKLGVTPQGGLFLLTTSLIGSFLNVPVSRRRVLLAPERRGWFYGLIFYHPPRVAEQVVAVNLGGAVVPVLFSAYLLAGHTPWEPALVATAIVAVVSRLVARPVPGVGIKMPGFVAPLVSAASALVLAPGAAPAVAYISGSLGTLIGADLLNLPAIRRMRAQIVSIGGAGVFDGVFISGILAVLLTA